MNDILKAGLFAIAQVYIVGLLNNYIFIIIKHMILYIFYFKYSVIRLYNAIFLPDRKEKMLLSSSKCNC